MIDFVSEAEPLSEKGALSKPKLKLTEARFISRFQIRFNSSAPLAGDEPIAAYEDETPIEGGFVPGGDGIRGHLLTLAHKIPMADILSGRLCVLHCGDAVFPIDLSWFYSRPDFVRSDKRLGALYSPERTLFRVWAPVASAVMLNRFTTGTDDEPGARPLGSCPMRRGNDGVWEVPVYGDLAGSYYTYTVTTAYGTQETVDVYSRGAGVNGIRSMVVNLSETDPDGWNDDAPRGACPATDALIWEVHVRDFSISHSSGMHYRGKFLAFTETGTTVPGHPEVSTGVDYLKRLGVTHVHLMPVFDYVTVDESRPNASYNWGYDPKNYNLPDGAYSTNPYDGRVRIREFKQMVQALHRAGLRVVMDVVYNHTYSLEDSPFQRTVPDYYYRKRDGYFSNASGCGNETASERPMFRRYMIDSLVYWAQEYHIDGFRFDLMKNHDVGTMRAIRAAMDQIDPEILLYGEGWAAGSPAIPDDQTAGKNNTASLNGIAFFNDAIRDSIKGSHCFDGSVGFVNGGGVTDKLIGGIEASVGDSGGQWGARWSDRSDKTITYTSAHDNLTLWDKLAGNATNGADVDWDADLPEILAMNRMAGGIVLTSHGIPFLQAGEEFCRTKHGNHNSYNSPDRDNAIDWTRLVTHAVVNDFYRGMIQIRKAFSGFRNLFERGGGAVSLETANIHFWRHEGNQLTYTLLNGVPGEWHKVAVAMNASDAPVTLPLGNGDDRWAVIADGTRAGLAELSPETRNTQSNELIVPPRSVMVAVEASSFDTLQLGGKRR